MQGIKKITVIILLLLCSFSLHSYDYSWNINYEIKADSLEYINKTIQNTIYELSEFHVYELDWDSFNKNEPKGHELGIKNTYYKLCLEKTNYEPYGTILQGEIYLTDVDSVVSFYIPYVKGNNKYYIHLVSYCKAIEKKDNKIFGKPGKYISFNDVEPTKNEIPIKESFEKNFMSKLPLEWEYERPAAIDRKLSKLLSLFRKRKNFSDE